IRTARLSTGFRWTREAGARRPVGSVAQRLRARLAWCSSGAVRPPAARLSFLRDRQARPLSAGDVAGLALVRTGGIAAEPVDAEIGRALVRGCALVARRIFELALARAAEGAFDTAAVRKARG